MEDRHRADWESRLREIRALRAGLAAPDRLIKFALQAINPSPARVKPGHFRLERPQWKGFPFPRRFPRKGDRAGARDYSGRTRGQTRSVACALRSRFPLRDPLSKAGSRRWAAYVSRRRRIACGSKWNNLGSEIAAPLQPAGTGFPARFLLRPLAARRISGYQPLAMAGAARPCRRGDPERNGPRSFFYVGDTKQAIYAWRGGDPRLFDEVADFYNASGTRRIDTSEALDVSFRSVPEILDAVNAIFSPQHLRRVAPNLDFPEQVLDRWTPLGAIICQIMPRGTTATSSGGLWNSPLKTRTQCLTRKLHD